MDMLRRNNIFMKTKKQKFVIIDGNALAGKTMTLVSGAAGNGWYEYTSGTMADGVHTYYFSFSAPDVRSTTVRLPATGNYSGPTVTSVTVYGFPFTETFETASPSTNLSIFFIFFIFLFFYLIHFCNLYVESNYFFYLIHFYTLFVFIFFFNVHFFHFFY